MMERAVLVVDDGAPSRMAQILPVVLTSVLAAFLSLNPPDSQAENAIGSQQIAAPQIAPQQPQQPGGAPAAAATGYSVSEFSAALQLARATALLGRINDPRSTVEQFDSALGLVHFRAPRAFAAGEVARLRRDVLLAWEIAARAAEDLSLPKPALDRNLGWSIALSEDSVLGGRGGANDQAYCHSAWIGPPADVVVDGYRLLHPCGVEESADVRERRLVRSLVHEAGHAFEFQLLGRGFSRRQRWHSEGFAVWFEMSSLARIMDLARSADPSAVSERASAAAATERLQFHARVRRAVETATQHRWKPLLFAGTPDDYAVSYALVSSIVAAGGVDRLRSVYRLMDEQHLSFEESVHRELGWTFAEWLQHAADLA